MSDAIRSALDLIDQGLVRNILFVRHNGDDQAAPIRDVPYRFNLKLELPAQVTVPEWRQPGATWGGVNVQNRSLHMVCGPRPLTLESGVGQGRKDGEAQEIVDLLLWRNYRFFDIEGCRTGNGTTPPRCVPPTPPALTDTPKIP